MFLEPLLQGACGWNKNDWKVFGDKGTKTQLTEEVFEKVFAALYTKITSPAVTDMLNKELKAMGTNLDALGGGVGKQLEAIKAGDKEGTKSVTDKVKGLFGK